MSDVRGRLARLSPEQRAALEHRLLRQRTARPAGIPARSDPGAPAPLSYGQERLWFLQRLDPADASYNMYMVQRLRGALSVPDLAGALTTVAARHPMLRARFPAVAGSPVQVVEPELRLEPVLVDLTDLPAAERESRATALVAELTNAPFDLATGPLVRVHLITLSATDHVFCLVLHHLVADGWSLKIIFSELAACYAGNAAGLSAPALDYRDYAAWQRGREPAPASVDYWRARLDGVRPLDLPTDRPRAAIRRPSGDYTARRVGPELTARLERLARDERGTLFMVLLAAYQLLLAAHCGTDDLTVGSVIAGRDRPELQDVVGFFPETLVLRGDLSGDPSFRTLLGRTRATVLDAFAHRDIPFERLLNDLGIRRDLSTTPLFQAMFVMQDKEAAALPLPGVEAEMFDPGATQAKFDLMLDITQFDGSLWAMLSYADDLFDEETAKRLLRRWERVLEAVADDPETPLSALRAAMLLPEDRQPGPGAPPPPAPDVLELFAERVRLTPGATAVSHGDRRVTYAELDAMAAALAGGLSESGVGRDTVVGLRAGRSIELVAGMLAVARAGGAYLPLDPAYPPERLRRMAADAGAALVLGEDELRDLRGPARPATPGSLAYVIYTSGSTGRPKGVEVPREALAARVSWMREHYGLGPGDRVLQFASPSFDTHAEEIYPALAAGAELVLCPDEPLPDFLKTPRGAALTVIDLPTSYWRELVAMGVAWPPGLRLLILGADPLPGPALAGWYESGPPGVRLVNSYGPTEATIIAATADMDPGEALRRPSVGVALPGTTLHVLAPDGLPVPPGVAGELYIGGTGLARGYLGAPALTAERFVPGPDGSRRYRTGDRARFRLDGGLEILGRLDRQVKVRGYRVEPGEVESALLAHPSVRQASVVVRDERLVAYVVHGDVPMDDSADALRDHLAAELPAHLMPGAIVSLDRIPLTPSGKVDQAALPAPGRARATAYEPPASDAEELVCLVWREVLGLERVGALDDFFQLGGHSLLATRTTARIAAATELEVPLKLAFTHPTPRLLAAALEHLAEEADARG
ncbi:amino acid adenylation domain-containing protein [Nonomuraea sp. NN258]|uniref:non-ribosomal peptide synthetase n=1 Tax=Nonomuraea antri TaxID=2730852 RepID=UPI0015685309|nr:non-ribosomal peptide synthetase [Nonomuraea antri]NRQ35523.1 amino acid adenylation domain-containing protein [Nonomuraea antri]